MANKVIYNNTSYDILDAITLTYRDYILLVNPNNIVDILFLESSIVDGERKYSLPPKTYDINKNSNVDLKRLQVNFIVQQIVDILKIEVNNKSLKNVDDIKYRFNDIKNFIYTDSIVKSIIEDNQNLNTDTFDKIVECIEKYFVSQLLDKANNVDEKQYNYLNKPLRNSNGLDYEWLYDLSLEELKEVARDKSRTSEDLIYIMDALNKRQKSDQAINNYTEMGKSFVLTKKDHNAAFIDIILLSLITISFCLLLLLNIF